ncbi:type VI secretion system baseplate subunit TssF [Thermodesulfobacteriota bacterium B35]
MLNRYYLQELAALRDLGREFADAHPAIASMLSGPTADPDVERLLEGVAFLTGLIREKLDDDFPEIVHDLVQLVWPHYLRPLPAGSIVAFRPRPSLKQPLAIPAGVQLASVPVEGTTCLFRTCYDVEVQPLRLLDAAFIEPPGRPAAIRLQLELSGMKLDAWQPEKLRIHLAGAYPVATERYYLLRRFLKRIVISGREGGECVLSPDHLRPVGLSMNEGSIPYPGASFPGYRILQEYFTLPQNFLFLDLVGWERWHRRGDSGRFEIRFELEGLAEAPPRIRRQDIVLFATPVINLFPHEADPIRLDHRRTEYRVRPTSTNADHFQVYSVDRVVGYVQGSATAREYAPFDHFNQAAATGPVYHLRHRRSPARQGVDVFLSVAYPPEAGPPVIETLSIGLTCTNGALPENIQEGDIRLPTSSTPEFVDFTNITTPTLGAQPPLDRNLLWRLLSHLSLNGVSLATAQNLKALLGLYLFPDTRDRTALLANRKRIAGIEKVTSRGVDRLVDGLMVRGREIEVSVRHDHFAGPGDLYLFGCVLNEFFSVYATINSFTRFVLRETLKGEVLSWPARIGERPLI